LGNTLVSYYRATKFAPVLHTIIRDVCDYLAVHSKSYDFAETCTTALTFNNEKQDLSIYPLDERLQAIFGLNDNFYSIHRQVLVAKFLAPIFATAILHTQAIPLLANLRSQGYLTGIISNTPWGSPASHWHEELSRLGLKELVDQVVFCVEAGKRKPDPLIFEYALHKLGVNSSEAWFVGDDPVWDVLGAKNAGMRPVLFDVDGRSQGIADVAVIRSLDGLYGLLQECEPSV
jgi:HAD superfamily hydrolase (TIGR01509 family)